MTNNLKIEVLVSNIPEDGSIASQFPSQEYVNQQLAKKPNLSPEGRLDPAQAPDYTEIPGLYEHIEDAKDEIGLSIADSLQDAKGYTNQQLSEGLRTKADLVNGKIPFDQIPFSADIEDQIQINVENITAVVDQKVAQVVGQVNEAATATNAYTDTKVAENKTYIDNTIGNVIEDVERLGVSKAVTIPTYLTPEAGVAEGTGVAAGAYFNVRSTEDDAVAVEYQNAGGSAVATGKAYPSSAALERLQDGYAIKKYLIDNGINESELDGDYDFLMQRLAQIASNKGLGASFVVYHDISQKNINDGFSSIAEMLAIANPKDGMRVFSSGQQHGWFKYNLSRIYENDGGTVFNGWERIDFDHITFDMFAADPTATIAEDAKIIAAFAASARLKKPLKNHSGNYLLDGANEVKISFDYDLNGTILKCGSNFSGGIKITRDAETVTYDAASALVTLLKTQGVVPERSASLPVLANDTTLDNSFIKIYTNQPYHRYRTQIVNRMEINRFLKRGQLLGGFFFSFDCSVITSVKSQKVAETYFNGTGLTVDETNVTQSMTLVRIDDGNSFRLSNFKFIDTSSAVASNMKNKIGIGLNAHSIEIDGVDTPATYINNPVESNYTLWGGENFDLTFKNVCSDGYGWGATGFNNCRRVTYEKCQLSRIDFHKPCHEWLKIDDCTIGNWGVLVTMLGDLIMNNPRFLARKAYVNDGFIRSRDDTGGFCNGNLIINNPVFDGDITTTVPLLHCSVGAGNELPSGTPIRPEFFTNVIVNNAIEESRVINLLLNSNQSTVRTIMPPASVNIKGFTFEKSAFVAAYFDRFAKRDEGVVFNIKDSNMQNLSMLDSGGVGTKVYSKLENMSGFNNAGLTLVVKTDGEYDVKTCKLLKYREFAGGWNTYQTKVNILGGSLVNTTDTAYFELESQAKNRIQLKDVRLTYGDSAAMRNDLHFFTSDGCFWNDSKTFALFTGDGTLNSTSFSLQAFGSIELLIKSGTSGAIKTDSVYVDISESGTTSLASSSGNVNVVVSGTTATITVSATSLRYVGMLSN